MKRLRAVEFHVQPILVLDDGESLEAVQAQPIVVPAAEWPSFSSERWPKELAATEDRLNADPEGEQ